MKRCDGAFPLQKEGYVCIPFKVGEFSSIKVVPQVLYSKPVLVFYKGRLFVLDLYFLR